MSRESTVGGAAWRVIRAVLLLAGVAVFVVGLLAAFVPAVERALPVGAAIEALGSDYVLLAVVGGAAVGIAVLVLVVHAIGGRDEAEPPEVEGIESAPHPGRAVDRATEGRLGPAVPDAVRRRLREAAVQAVARREACSRSEAERRVAAGRWTDDPVAAGFVAGRRNGGAAHALRALVGADDRVERTVAAIERTAGDDHQRGSDDAAGGI